MIPQDWQAVQWDSGCGDGLFITILYHGKRFHISLLPPSSPDTVEGPLILKFDSIDDEGEDQVLAVQKEIETIVYKAGESVWDRLAPPVPNGMELSDLHSLLYPETFPFRFVTNDGKAELIPHEIDQAMYHDRFGMKIVNDIGLPQYSSKDVLVLDTLVGEGYIAKVSAGGKEMCCKSSDEVFWQAMEREFDCLRKVARSHLANLIRVPRLLGLITSAETGVVVGILEEYIPTGTLSDLGELREKEVSPERIKKWAAQIRETVTLLHEIGVVWGDGKPHNILIHEETDEAWLIDFGGSYTDGWVDEKLMETVEGDEQAVGKIMEFLESLNMRETQRM
jgi:serine/threonine protein kinase